MSPDTAVELKALWSVGDTEGACQYRIYLNTGEEKGRHNVMVQWLISTIDQYYFSTSISAA